MGRCVDVMEELDRFYDAAIRGDLPDREYAEKFIYSYMTLTRTPEANRSMKYYIRLWRAVKGEIEALRETAWMFDWHTDKNKPSNRDFDNIKVAVFWYEQAAKRGDSIAQCNVANIYCSSKSPPWNGKRAVYWREKSAAQKQPNGMRGLAYCLECGHCCQGGMDKARATALRKEADEIQAARGEKDDD